MTTLRFELLRRPDPAPYTNPLPPVLLELVADTPEALEDANAVAWLREQSGRVEKASEALEAAPEADLEAERRVVSGPDECLEADARTRTGDPFITSVDRLSPPVAASRTKPHESKESTPPRWRPKTSIDSGVDPAWTPGPPQKPSTGNTTRCPHAGASGATGGPCLTQDDGGGAADRKT